MSLRPFFVIGIPAFIIVLSIVLSGLKSHTQLGRQGRKDMFNPAENVNSGFVGGANQLLDALLLDTIKGDCPVTDLESLNRKYQALVFALPYGEEHKSVIEASDLRLVGIRAERLKSEADRMFYYNSRLPQLLQKQREQLSETYFRISCKGLAYDAKTEKKPVKVTRVELIPSMFRVALTKDPWTGVVQGAQNCLFDETATVFLNYGNSILPLPKLRRADLTNSIKLQAVADEASLLTAKGTPLDYYDLYRTLFQSADEGGMACANIQLKNSRSDSFNHSFTVCCAHDSLYLRSSMKIRVFGKSDTYEVAPKQQGNQHDASLPIEDGMKIVVYDASDYKVSELTLFTHDPTRTLSSLLLTDVGRERATLPAEHTDLFTRQVLRGLSRNMSNTYNIDTVQLSIDPLLSKVFETELENYLKSVRKSLGTQSHIDKNSEQYDISLTVMDMATGDIIASPYYTTRFEEIPEDMQILTRNPAMSRRFVGSAFKPMVALASVLTNPSLINLNTQGKYHLDEGGKTATFFGRKTLSWANKLDHWGGTQFTDFLSYSDDVYPVALTALAMTGAKTNNDTNVLPLNGNYNFFTLNPQNYLLTFRKADEVDFGNQNHPFNDWISYLYSANYDTDNNTDTIFKHLYVQNNLNNQERRYGLEELIPDPMNLNLNRFLEGADFRKRLTPWVLGQGDNQWSCVKLAEAWCRMLSKRNVLATLIHNQGEVTSLVDGVEAEPQKRNVYGPVTKSAVNNTWNEFLLKLHDAQGRVTSHENTLISMHNQVNTLNESGIKHHLVLFSKTGTPNTYDRYETPLIGGNRRQIDLGTYCFGLMDQREFDKVQSNQPARGIVAVIRITRTYECKYCTQKHEKCDLCSRHADITSRHARNFFSNSQGRLRKFYDMTKKYY